MRPTLLWSQWYKNGRGQRNEMTEHCCSRSKFGARHHHGAIFPEHVLERMLAAGSSHYHLAQLGSTFPLGTASFCSPLS